VVAARKEKPNLKKITREYVAELRKGDVPDGSRPDLDPEWDDFIFENIETKIYKMKGKGTPEKRAEKMGDVIDDLCKFNKGFQAFLHPAPKEPKVKADDEPICPLLPAKFDYLKPLAATACKWVDECVAFLRKWSPRGYEGYYEAVAMAILSTVAARRVATNFAGSEYTPLYIALVGPTTFFKKSTTAKHLSGMLEAAGLDWLLGADVTTPQKLLSNMAGKKLPENYGDLPDDEKEWEKKRLAFAGQVGWYYDEFGNHLDAMVKENGIMADFCGLLRLLDDGKKKHRYDTHRRDKEIIYNPALSLLAALTPADIRPHAQKGNKFWRDGLFARFAFVCVPKITKFKLDRALRDDLIYPMSLTAPLQAWHQWLGEPEIDIQEETDKDGNIVKYNLKSIKGLPEKKVILPDDVEDALYDYEKAIIAGMCQVGDDGTPPLVPDALHGNYGRLPKLALRIAMLLASFDNQGRVDQPCIEMRHWARAQAFAEERRKDLHELYAQTNAPDDNPSAELEEEIIRHMTRLAERGTEWVTANGLRGYMKGKSREEIENKLRALSKSEAIEAQKTAQSTKYRLREQESIEDE
jgi:hypothetical protein